MTDADGGICALLVRIHLYVFSVEHFASLCTAGEFFVARV